MSKAKVGVLGGTFDVLHEGHKQFILFALERAENLIIGLTTDRYVRERKPEIIHMYDARKEYLLEFLKSIHAIDRTRIVPIDDVYGITLDSSIQLDTIFATDETLKGAREINSRRKQLGLKSIEVVVFPKRLPSLSSTQIRKGVIDRKGSEYIKKEWLEKLLLPQKLRTTLEKPFGEVVSGPDWIMKNRPLGTVVTVGDETTLNFLRAGIFPSLAIVDLHIRRKKRHQTLQEFGFPNLYQIYIAKNDPGTLDPSLFQVLKTHFSSEKKGILLVKGEEDLAVLPAVLFAPLNSVIFYGQPGEGMVRLEVTEELKVKCFQIISKFEVQDIKKIV